MANAACGLAGIIAVIIAGWTTANPTIYRAGLAFQAIMPNRSRFVVTLCTGLLATVAGIFPGIAMRLLDFVALYGLLLMPMGAVIFADFWLLPKLGLKSYWAERTGTKFNWAAAAAWFATLGICLLTINQITGYTAADGSQPYKDLDPKFFISLPGWFVAIVIYVICNYLMQQDESSAATVDNTEPQYSACALRPNKLLQPPLLNLQCWMEFIALRHLIAASSNSSRGPHSSARSCRRCCTSSTASN